MIGSTRQSQRHILLIAVIMVLAFWLSINNLNSDSFWLDEGWTAWTIHTTGTEPDGLREVASAAIQSVKDVLNRVREHDVHPPLYYLLLDVWTLIIGESGFAIRILSVFWGVIALAATYAIAARLNRLAGVLAIIFLSTSGFFLYYTHEARMYTMLLALSTVSMLAYLHWIKDASWRNTLLYGVILSAMIYTHYLGVLIAAIQILYLLLSLLIGKSELSIKRVKLAVPFVITALLFAPWIPSLIYQIQAHPSGPAGLPLTTDINTVNAIFLLIATSAWGWFAIAAGIGLWALWRTKQNLILLLLWLIAPPLVLLIWNQAISPIFQMRYIIVILPAWFILIAYGISQIERMEWFSLRYPLVILTVLVIGYNQLAPETQAQWPARPDWRGIIAEAAATRDSLEPAIAIIPDTSVVAYYDRQFHLSSGITVNLSWRDHNTDEIHQIMSVFEDGDAVWAFLPVNHPQSWDIVNVLSASRKITYRRSVMNFIFYRFESDDSTGTTIEFQFGEDLRYLGGTGHQYYARIGEELCTELEFSPLMQLPDASYGVIVQLTQGFNTVRSSWQAELKPLEATTLSPCLTVPQDADRGPYHLRLIITETATGKRIPVFDTGGDIPRNWWDFLIIANVAVDIAE